MRGPWWMEGVPFKCQENCGACCDQPGGIVYLAPKDAERIASHHKMEVKEWLARDCKQTLDGRFVIKSRPEDGICIYLDENKKCEIYSVRPQQCKAFPWWGENLRSDKAWAEVKSDCPGLTADDAIIVEGNTIRLHVFADRTSTRGFRSWPPF